MPSSGLALLVRGPERQIVAEQLHDEGGVLVGVLCDVVELGDRVLEGGARHLARLVRVRQHLVLKHREVQSKTEADRVRHCQVLGGNRLRLLVGTLGVIRSLRLVIATGVFGNVAVVVGLHLLVEDLRLACGCLSDETVVQHGKDLLANVIELTLHLLAILLRELCVLLVALAGLLLLHAGDDTPCSAARTHGVLVGHGQEIAFFN
mmetsp:Transcript_89521/g.253312  ORF Transcript_89521/g.253312 Transcript_89521/m.253312 type:complete len:206 (+) Transcript_89521:224-841(+)